MITLSRGPLMGDGMFDVPGAECKAHPWGKYLQFTVVLPRGQHGGATQLAVECHQDSFAVILDAMMTVNRDVAEREMLTAMLKARSKGAT